MQLRTPAWLPHHVYPLALQQTLAALIPGHATSL